MKWKCQMQLSANFRAGYRSKYWIAEAVVDNMNTLGGFDIRKNDMPFPSNKMNATRVGANFKHTLKAVKGLEITGGPCILLLEEMLASQLPSMQVYFT